MRSAKLSVIMAATDPNGIALSQTPGGAGNLTLNGVLVSGGVATMDIARHIEVTSAGNDSARTFTFTGTNRYGDVITEALAGPNIGTTTGLKNFKTVTQIAVDAATAGAITAGTADSAESKWYPTNMHKTPFNVGMHARLVQSGTLTYTVQDTGEDLQDRTGATGVPEDDVIAQAHPSLTGTTNKNGNYSAGVKGIRIQVTGHSVGGVILDVNQAGW